LTIKGLESHAIPINTKLNNSIKCSVNGQTTATYIVYYNLKRSITVQLLPVDKSLNNYNGICNE